jgi:pyrimidine operon attenuation protein / uracil phosphoribosyltransferase
MASTKVQVLDEATIQRKLTRMAYEIVEQNFNQSTIILAGILNSGFTLASSLKSIIEAISQKTVHLIAVQIDKKNPTQCNIINNQKIDITNNAIIIVDDVANSGRTLLYAIAPFLQNNITSLQVAVLVDRKHKSFPITPDFIGLSISTTLQEQIVVEINNQVAVAAYIQ